MMDHVLAVISRWQPGNHSLQSEDPAIIYLDFQIRLGNGPMLLNESNSLSSFISLSFFKRHGQHIIGEQQLV